MKHVLVCLLLSVLGAACSDSQRDKTAVTRPNLLLIVADDLGYADLGCYGGDIATPDIDMLAATGVRFSRFHTSPYCAPTRAMLLSGNDNHIAGMGRQSLRTDVFGYEGELTERIATIPEILRDAGYHTYMAGKWHLGMRPSADPHEKGFEHSYVLLPGAGNHYNDQGLFEAYPVSPYREDGHKADYPAGAYSTNFYTDKLIEYIDTNLGDGKPFFVFAAYTSPHWPLQVDEKFWKKYTGRYDDGYEKLRSRRLKSLKTAGMIPADAALPPSHPRVRPWDSLTGDEKKKESRKMELYAGMVDNLNHNIGRLFDYLKSVGEFENTIIVFMSDNGAAAEDFYYDQHYGPFIRSHFSDSYEEMGGPGSFISYGPQWAEAGSAPFRYFKGETTEGGIIAPLIISGPGVNRRNDINHSFITLMDIAPTIYELAGTSYPREFQERKLYPLKGNSLLPVLSGDSEQVHDSEYVYGLEHGGKAMLRKGDWKITSTVPPFDPHKFGLYDLRNDLAENNDLRHIQPQKFDELLNEWSRFAEMIGARFPTPKPGME